jgi:hypothetical protein
MRIRGSCARAGDQRELPLAAADPDPFAFGEMLDAQGVDCHCRGLAIGGRGSRKGAAMRGTPHQHDFAHGKREGAGAALRHIPEGQRPSARIPARDRLAIDPHRTGERRQ